MYCIYTFGDIGSDLCREVVPFSEGPLLEVPLYYCLVYVCIISCIYNDTLVQIGCSSSSTLSTMTTIGTDHSILIVLVSGILYY